MDKYLAELLEKNKSGALKPSDRFAIPAQPMPEQDPVVRSRNTSEVALGYTETQARLEALRCLSRAVKSSTTLCRVS